MIRPENLFFAGARARFRREAEAVARLQHPGIVPIYAVGEEQGIPYIAMELVRGCTLADALRAFTGRAPETLRGSDLHDVVAAAANRRDSSPEGTAYDGGWIEACLRIARQVADALQHAHEHGLVHRDVKPSNIALTPEGRALLLDFGLTRAEGGGDMTRSGSALGTLHYMSPEQLRGARAVDARSDVYSLGATLYEMLALQVPHRGEDALEMQRLTQSDPPEPIHPRNRRVAADVETVVLCALDREPARRYASASDLARDIGRLLAHRPIAARRPSAWLRARRWSQRRPAVATALVLAPVILLGAGAALLGQALQHSRELSEQLEQVRAAREATQRESERARREAEAAEGALEFVSGLFGPIASSQRIRDTPMTAVEILEHGKSSVDHGYIGHPLVKARIQAMLGIAFARLGEDGRAIDLLESACTRWRAESSSDLRSYLASALHWEGVALHHLGRDDEARGRLEEALELWPGDEAGERGRNDTQEALVMVPARPRDAARGDSDLQSDLRAALARPGLGARELGELHARLGYALVERKRYDEAAASCEIACKVLNVPGAVPNAPLVHLLSNFSQARAGQGRLDDALALNDRALAAARSLVPPAREEIGILLANRGSLQARRGELDSALRDLREADQVLSRALEPDHPFALDALMLLANTASRNDRCADAEEAACEIMRRTDGDRARPGDASRAIANAARARCAELRGDRAAAKAHWREAASRLRGLASNRMTRLRALCSLERLCFEDGELSECGALLDEAVASLDEGTLSDVECRVLEQAVQYCSATGRDAAARSYASRLEE
jgi:tetratricopeptide (TPR) repeat protein/tRNA A-37 threonylcarbamoyl transferase component Bud32